MRLDYDRRMAQPPGTFVGVDPLERAGELDEALSVAVSEARAYLERLGAIRGRRDTAAALEGLGGPLPEAGDGALALLRELGALGRDAATRPPGRAFTS